MAPLLHHDPTHQAQLVGPAPSDTALAVLKTSIKRGAELHSGCVIPWVLMREVLKTFPYFLI